MDSDLMKELAIDPISTVELERRWKATRQAMRDEGIDFLTISEDISSGSRMSLPLRAIP
jgi:hypothetical protein